MHSHPDTTSIQHATVAQSSKNIGVAFFLNLLFTLIEFIGGILTNSVSIQSDALHDAGDSISIGIAWYLQKISGKGNNDTFTFGYRRFNTLGAILTGTILVAGSAYILSQAIPRIFDPQQVDAKNMIWLSALGILVNGMAAFNLRRGNISLNEQMISWHLIEDVLGWMAVLIGSICMYFYGVYWVDPLLSLIITCFILYHVIKNLKKAVHILLQGTPADINLRDIQDALEELPGIEEVHHLHCWTMDGQYHLFSAHVVAPEVDREAYSALKSDIKRILQDTFHIEHATLEIEHEKSEENC